MAVDMYVDDCIKKNHITPIIEICNIIQKSEFFKKDIKKAREDNFRINTALIMTKSNEEIKRRVFELLNSTH